MVVSLDIYLLLLACVLAALAPYVLAAPCPHLARALQMEAEAADIASSGRNLLYAMGSPTFRPTRAYLKAAKQLFDDFRGDVKNCAISPRDMNYDESAGFEPITGPGVFQPASAWLRFFFHDAGTFDANPTKKTGGLNGSIGSNCLTEECFDKESVVPAPQDSYCSNGFKSVGNFFPYDGKHFCCDYEDQCIGRYANENGETIPVCVTGSPVSTEICRPENDGLLPTLSFFREHQRQFPLKRPRYRGACMTPDHDIYDRNCFVTLADAIVLGAVAVVKECSQGKVELNITLGRVDSKVADEFMPPLPSPNDIIDAQHGEVFRRMGLGKKDQATLLTGSHSIGGFRRDNSPGLTDCPFIPFDCTPSGQFNQTSVPFDNNVFKVACDGVARVSVGSCDWNTICTNTAEDEPGCPFGAGNSAAFDKCNGVDFSFPKPGLVSDIHMCKNMKGFRGTMVKFARNNEYFYSEYKLRFNKMAVLGYDPAMLTPVGFF